MAVERFIPEVWSAKFMDDLEKDLVFKEDCNHDYEGDAKKPGDAVRILGVGDIETSRWSDGKLHKLAEPQEVAGNTQLLPINQIETFHFNVDDLEKAQAQGGNGLLAKYTTKAKDAVAEAMDSYIAKLHVGKGNSIEYKPAKSISVDGSNSTMSILDVIDEAELLLREQNVGRNTKITITAPPKFFTLLRRAYIELDTSNSQMLKNGWMGTYNGIHFKESNNVYKDDTGLFHIQVKTQDALAFVNPYTHMEGYRPDNYFTDVVKGYSVFDGKVIAPKQIVDMAIKFA